MVTFDSLLTALYHIQGAADPAHPEDSNTERLQEIFDLAAAQLLAAGWQGGE